MVELVRHALVLRGAHVVVRGREVRVRGDLVFADGPAVHVEGARGGGGRGGGAEAGGPSRSSVCFGRTRTHTRMHVDSAMPGLLLGGAPPPGWGMGAFVKGRAKKEAKSEEREKQKAKEAVGPPKTTPKSGSLLLAPKRTSNLLSNLRRNAFCAVPALPAPTPRPTYRSPGFMDSPSTDSATAARIAAARAEALSMLNGPFSPPPNPTSANPPSDAADHFGRHSMDDPEPDTEPYTPGRLASTSFSSTADAYLYPSYSSPPKPKPVFVPASVTVKVPPADEVFTKGTDAALAQSLGKASPRGGSPKGQARPEHQKSSSGGGALIFTQSEARSLQARVRGDRRQLHALKRLVAPDLKRVEGAFVELMTRVMVRGEAVGNADKALVSTDHLHQNNHHHELTLPYPLSRRRLAPSRCLPAAPPPPSRPRSSQRSSRPCPCPGPPSPATSASRSLSPSTCPGGGRR